MPNIDASSLSSAGHRTVLCDNHACVLCTLNMHKCSLEFEDKEVKEGMDAS